MKTRQQLLTATLKYCPREGTFDTPLPGLRIVRREKKTGATPGMYDPIVCLVLQGEKQVWSGKKVLRYNPENYLVSCIDVPATFQVVKASKKEPYVGLTLQLQPSIIYRLLQEAPTAVAGKQETGGAMFVEKVTPDLRQAFLRLLATLDIEADRKILAPAIIDEIHYRLMNSRFGAKIQQLGVAGSKTHRISKVLDHLRKDFAAPLKIGSLAEMANMSPSAFHLHFRQVTSMSPLQYQKQIRLQEARRLLSVEEMDATSVAFRVGYESPSQFSREYRRLFGQPPMRDVEQQREMVVA
jgi:AraC-like DNA-binding protein